MVTMRNETKWTIDPAHSEIAFHVKHMMIATVKGRFKKFEANVYTVGFNFATADIDLSIDSASLDTGDEKRDAQQVDSAEQERRSVGIARKRVIPSGWQAPRDDENNH